MVRCAPLVAPIPSITLLNGKSGPAPHLNPLFFSFLSFLFANRGRSEYFQLPQRTIEASNALAHDSDASRQNNSIFFFFPPPPPPLLCEAGERNTPPERKEKQKIKKQKMGKSYTPRGSSLTLSLPCLQKARDFSPLFPRRATPKAAPVEHCGPYCFLLLHHRINIPASLLPFFAAAAAAHGVSTVYSYTYGRDIILAQRLSSSPPPPPLPATLLISFLHTFWSGFHVTDE